MEASMAQDKFDLYQDVTDKIIAALEAGTPPWRKPWSGDVGGAAFPLRWNGESYRGINVLLLWLSAWSRGFTSARWLTFRQAQELGAQVKKGAKSELVVKYGTFDKEDDSGAEVKVPYLKSYRVFNADEIEGLPADFYIRPEAPRDLGTKADPSLDAFFDQTGLAVDTTSEPRAYYNRVSDRIHMPPIETFYSANGYYATLAHESIHATGSDKRLARFEKFNDRKAYAFEELVAEIGACMLSVTLGLVPEFDQSASYVESWLTALSEDKKAIFRAASEAQKAVDFLTAETAAEHEVEAA